MKRHARTKTGAGPNFNISYLIRGLGASAPELGTVNMAKAKYHKSQRVFVKPVGTWAYVEAVVPKWIKGCEEPIKITDDCGVGREQITRRIVSEVSQ